MPETTFPEFITARRRELELTLGDVASTVGVSPITVSNWSNGQSVPQKDNLIALAEVLDLPPDELASIAGVELDPEPIDPPDSEIQLDVVDHDGESNATATDDVPAVGIPTIEHPALEAAEAAALQAQAAADEDEGTKTPSFAEAEEAPEAETAEPEPPPLPPSRTDVAPRMTTASSNTGQTTPLTYVQDPQQLLRYRIRWAITTVALIIMAFVLIWALAGLIDSLSSVKESVTTP